MAEKFSEAIGRPVKFESPEVSDPDVEQLASRRFFSDKAYTSDINALRWTNPDLLDFTT
jgi:hypothetical protein